MKSEDGTGSRHALVVLKEMWIVTHLFHSTSGQVTKLPAFVFALQDNQKNTFPSTAANGKVLN
jgi:hypothetical protein